RLREIFRLISSGSKSAVVVPSSTRPSRVTAPTEKRSASTREVLPTPPWPTKPTLRILAQSMAMPASWTEGATHATTRPWTGATEARYWRGFRILTEKVRKSSTSGRLRFEGAIAAYRAKAGRARIQAERSDSEHSADGVAERCLSASVRRRGRSAGPGALGPHPPTRLGEVLPQSVGQGQAGE